MDKTVVTGKENGIDYRARPSVLMDFAQTWVSRHGAAGGFSVSKFADRVKNCVTVKLQAGVMIESCTSDGAPVNIIDLSDILSGYAYYAVLKKDSDNNELLAIIDETELNLIAGPGAEVSKPTEDDEPESVEYRMSEETPVVEQKNTVDETQTVLLRYTKRDGDGNADTKEVRRGELQTMIIQLLADGVPLESIEVWSQCRRPQINVEL